MRRHHTPEQLQLQRLAKERGEPTYYGPSCRYGHNGLRYTANRVCVSCSRVHSKKRYQKMPTEERQEYAQKNGGQTLLQDKRYTMIASAKHRARTRGLPFNLSLSDINIPELCPVLGTLMESPSLDRFDNTKGYTPDNVRVISKRANSLKSDATLDEMQRIVAYMEGKL